ncbi:hypothetical protein D3C85_547190 [compost metagenome]
MFSLPSAIIRPSDGIGAGTPRPRNDSEASSVMAIAASTVPMMSRLPTRFGRMSRQMICRCVQPCRREAVTNSALRSPAAMVRATSA